MPTSQQPGNMDPTSAYIVQMTVEAAQQTAQAAAPGQDNGGGQPVSPTAAVFPTNTAAVSSGPHGTDQARFVSDVTINDYSQVNAGDQITKTWRLQNIGTATWTTGYALVFDKEQQMGAPQRVPLTENVPPDGYVNISVDFTAPDTSGEYKSYWMLENDQGDQFGTGPEFDQPIWMIIVVASDNVQTGNQSGGIAGGATITNATVTASTVNYTGACPAQINFTYSVTTSDGGNVNAHLILNAISPAAYTFDDPGISSNTVAGATTFSLPYLYIGNSTIVATARVQAVGANTFTSPPLQFSVTCN